MWEIAAIAGGAVAGLVWLAIWRYVALGDSLAAGVGSFTFYGYVPRFALRLIFRLKRLVLTTNLGRFGMTSGDLLIALQTDERFRKAVRRARLITVDIGGNDLRHCNYQEECLEQTTPRFRRTWEAVLYEIRELNPTADLLVLTLYVPFPQGDIRRPAVERFVGELNGILTLPALLEVYGVTAVARVYEAFTGQECDYTWFCRLGDVHPTDSGYAAMAACLEAVYPLPSSLRRRKAARRTSSSRASAAAPVGAETDT